MKVNQEKFQLWHDQYRPRLLESMAALVKDRDTAEDIAATALATAFENIDQFRGDAEFGTWLHRIALNEAHNRMRCKRGVSLDALGRAAFIECSEADRVSDDLEHSESCQKLSHALDHLPAIHRQALVDHFVHGYSIKQVARRRRVPLGTVLSRISTAKRLLRAEWDRAGRNAGR